MLKHAFLIAIMLTGCAVITESDDSERKGRPDAAVSMPDAAPPPVIDAYVAPPSPDASTPDAAPPPPPPPPPPPALAIEMTFPGSYICEGTTLAGTVKLSRDPGASLTVTIAPQGAAVITPTPTMLTFTTANWNTPQALNAVASTGIDAETVYSPLYATAPGAQYGWAYLYAAQCWF